MSDSNFLLAEKHRLSTAFREVNIQINVERAGTTSTVKSSLSAANESVRNIPFYRATDSMRDAHT